jgi:hypothetical protein
MAHKAGRSTRNPTDKREQRTMRGTRKNRRLGTKSRQRYWQSNTADLAAINRRRKP